MLRKSCTNNKVNIWEVMWEFFKLKESKRVNVRISDGRGGGKAEEGILRKRFLIIYNK